MNSNRLISMIVSALTLVIVPAMSPAIDINPTRLNDLSEAAAFFSHIASTSKNPIIASMAEDSLRQIQKPEETQSRSTKPDKSTARKVVEITMLPQQDHTFVVPAMVNRKYMATFLIDTGASYTVITPQMAEALGIRLKADNPTLPVTTANGTLNAPVVTLKNVSLGGMRVDEVEAVITDLGDAPQISGLLGMSFFRGMDLTFKQDNRLVISR